MRAACNNSLDSSTWTVTIIRIPFVPLLSTNGDNHSARQHRPPHQGTQHRFSVNRFDQAPQDEAEQCRDARQFAQFAILQPQKLGLMGTAFVFLVEREFDKDLSGRGASSPKMRTVRTLSVRCWQYPLHQFVHRETNGQAQAFAFTVETGEQ